MEYHIHTLTDSNESALKLIKEVNHKNVLNYWQPPVNDAISHADCKNGLKSILNNLSNVHVYHWTLSGEVYTRYSLEEGYSQWKDYMEIVKTTGKDHYALLEYIKDDSLEQLNKDAEILNKLIS